MLMVCRSSSKSRDALRFCPLLLTYFLNNVRNFCLSPVCCIVRNLVRHLMYLTVILTFRDSNLQRCALLKRKSYHNQFRPQILIFLSLALGIVDLTGVSYLFHQKKLNSKAIKVEITYQTTQVRSMLLRVICKETKSDPQSLHTSA